MVDIVPENLYFSPQTPEDSSQQDRTSKEFLRLADQLALQGQFTAAFNNYSKAFKLCSSSFPPAVLQCLAEALSSSHTNRTILAHMSSEESKLFRCYLCKAVLFKPTTLSCGHTFCHKCLQNNENWACRLCGVTDYILDRKNCPPTTLLLDLVEKVFPKHCQAERLRQKGKKCMQRKEYLQAIKLFTQALEEAPSSHLVLSNRSLAYSHLEQYNLALKDAERVIEMQPTWPKGYYRKGCILSEMHNCEAAVTALLDCLAINPYWSRPKEKLLMALHQVLSEDVKREQQLCSSSLPHSLTKRAQLACLPRNECAPSSGETSDRESQMSPSSSWYHSPKLPGSRTHDYAQDKGGKGEGVKEYQAGAAAADYGAAASIDYEEISEKSVSDCDELEEEEYFSYQSCRKKRNSLPTQLDGKTLIDSMPSHAASDPSLFLPDNQKEDQQEQQSNPAEENLSQSWTSQSEQSQCEEYSLCAASCCQPQLQLLKQDDLQCSLCLFLLYQPLVTPCGHAFCRECLVRSLDHSAQCPLCKQSLTAYLAAHKWAVSESLESIIKSFFPVELARRKKIHEEEMSRLAQVEDNCEIPVFVCTFACPTIRCPLHIFEPRYRLMIRRCLECGSRQFGMTTATSMSGDYAEYGCMLKIKNVQTLDDGRSLLDTVGDKRFKVLEKGTKDGYNIARVSFLKDEPIESSKRADLINFEREVYVMCKQWLDCLRPESLRRISEHYGPLPIPQEAELDQPNGPSWVWWMITILPIDNKLQVTAMSFTKLYKRLQFIKSAILTIQSKLSS